MGGFRLENAEKSGEAKRHATSAAASKVFKLAIGVVVCLAIGMSVGCAPRQATEVASTGGSADAPSGQAADSAEDATATTGFDMASWTSDSNCETCHSAEQASLSDETLPASHHSGDCTTCHKDLDDLTATHTAAQSSVRQPSAKFKGEMSNDLCFGCHGSYEELAEKTADSTALSDEQGRVVNPHAVPDVEGHETPLECTSCHQMHKTYEPMQYCEGCHHEGGFECGTCHEV